MKRLWLSFLFFFFSLQFPLSWVHLILHWIFSPSPNWCLRKKYPSSGRKWLSVWQFCLLFSLNIALCFYGTCCKFPLTSVCNIINKKQTPQIQSEIMSRSYVNLAGVTTKCLLNGETQVSVCVIELKYGLYPAFGKLWKKLICSKQVVECDYKLLSLLFFMPMQSS